MVCAGWFPQAPGAEAGAYCALAALVGQLARNAVGSNKVAQDVQL